MTDRIKGCWVAFDHDIREDDADPLVDAILQLKGVASVRTNVAEPSDWMNRERVKRELLQEMMALLSPDRTR